MATCRWWSINNRNAGGILGISFQLAIEQFSEDQSGEDDCRRYTPGPTLTAREGWAVARTRFFTEFRRVADEHLLLPRRDPENRGLRNPGDRTWESPRIWVHAPRSVTQRSNRADRN